jgi:addiction module RelB/DinJ family antitoxin
MQKKTTTIHLRLSTKLKKSAEAIAAANGLDLSSCIRMFLTHMNVRGALPLPPLTVNGFTVEEEDAILRAMNEPTIPIPDLDTFFKTLKEDVRD